MKYISTRDTAKKPYTLQEAALLGLAPDGGLFVPEHLPRADMAAVWDNAGKSFAALSSYLSGLFFGEELGHDLLSGITREAFDFPIRLHCLGDEKYTLELFHGPTYAFKDVGARFMGKMLNVLNGAAEEIVILTATSGDTGSAVAHGFYDIPGIKAVILYPDGSVSDLQERQMTVLGKNIHPVKVRGTFDDCQRMVKTAFNDPSVRKRKNITSANSINLLRWIPQSFYYFYGYCLWKEKTGRDFPVITVPSGNYGNLAAGMMAKKMGLPVRSFIAASNINDVIPRYLQTGRYEPRPSLRTIANAMDVGNPSNYERILYLYRNNYRDIKREVRGYVCTDAEIRKTISGIYRKYGYISDPHSAVGYRASEYYGADGFWLSTAHGAKFAARIGNILGTEPEMPTGLQKLLQKEKRFVSAEANYECFKEILMNI